MLMQNSNRELEKEEARLKLADYGWSIEELTDFGIENILNVSGTQLYTKLMETRFPHKTLGEIIELYDLLKAPFNFKWNKAEYKRIQTDQEKKEFLDEIRYEVGHRLITDNDIFDRPAIHPSSIRSSNLRLRSRQTSANQLERAASLIACSVLIKLLNSYQR